MPRKSLRPNLNQIRAWVRQGRTDAWVAHQLDVSVRDIEQFKRQNELVSDDAPAEGTIAADYHDEVDLRAEDDALIAAELEAAEIEAERARATRRRARLARPRSRPPRAGISRTPRRSRSRPPTPTAPPAPRASPPAGTTTCPGGRARPAPPPRSAPRGACAARRRAPR